MKIRTAFIAALAGVFAVTAAAPSFAAGDPVKKEKRINRMIKRADLNGDSKISQSEMTRGIAVTFALLDTNKDGQLSQNEIGNARSVLKAHRKQAKASGEAKLQYARFPAKRIGKHMDRIDANKDGMISKAELSSITERMFKKRDRDHDGYITAADFTKR